MCKERKIQEESTSRTTDVDLINKGRDWGQEKDLLGGMPASMPLRLLGEFVDLHQVWHLNSWPTTLGLRPQPHCPSCLATTRFNLQCKYLMPNQSPLHKTKIHPMFMVSWGLPLSPWYSLYELLTIFTSHASSIFGSKMHNFEHSWYEMRAKDHGGL